MARSKIRRFSMIFLLVLIVQSVSTTEEAAKIQEKSSPMIMASFEYSRENLGPSGNRLENLEEQISKLTQKFSVFEHRQTGFANSDTIQNIPEIEKISKIVDDLQSKDEAARSELSKLNVRVSRLEENDYSNHNVRNKRETNKHLNSTAVPCSIRACAFDYKVNVNKTSTEKHFPTSCKDLYKMGHVLNGFYHIQASGNVELVFCDFMATSTEEMETRIGYIDIKSAPIFFFVEKDADHNTYDTPIPFEIEKTNIGNAIDIKTGVFIAPKPGIYYFAYSGIRDNWAGETMIYLQVNEEHVAGGHGAGSILEGGLTMSLHSTLRLKKDDKVSLVLTAGSITPHCSSTQFTGWLVEEENIFVSL